MNDAPINHRLRIEADPAFTPPIGDWFWLLTDVRRRTLNLLSRFEEPNLDHEPPGAAGSAGSLLYHIAATDLNWLYDDVLEVERDERYAELLPHPYYGENERLFALRGVSLEAHLERLAATRAMVIDTFQNMSPEEFVRERHVNDYLVTPQWVAYHLAGHERYHAGQISLLLASAV